MKLDILVFAAHPDDAEMSCAGTIMRAIDEGKKVGIIDLTRGEMGTRGTAITRAEESAAATKILGIHARENLDLEDCFFDLSKESQLAIIRMIRKYKPQVVLANAIEDRHPDHGRAAKLVQEAFFKAGLPKIESFDEQGNKQEAYRPDSLFHYIQDRYIKPDFVIDISAYIDRKLEAIKAFKTQFHDPTSKEPLTYISKPDFLESLIGRNREYGKLLKNGTFGEGYTVNKILEVNSLTELF
jgi:N-acetylglucosamine malate deacetylase 1